MALSENNDPRHGQHSGPRGDAHENSGPSHFESEEEEMIHNDPAERAVSGQEMDRIAESGKRDPLIGGAVNHETLGDGTRAGEDATR
jgi:hypothetical protein